MLLACPCPSCLISMQHKGVSQGAPRGTAPEEEGSVPTRSLVRRRLHRRHWDLSKGSKAVTTDTEPSVPMARTNPTPPPPPPQQSDLPPQYPLQGCQRDRVCGAPDEGSLSPHPKPPAPSRPAKWLRAALLHVSHCQAPEPPLQGACMLAPSLKPIHQLKGGPQNRGWVQVDSWQLVVIVLRGSSTEVRSACAASAQSGWLRAGEGFSNPPMLHCHQRVTEPFRISYSVQYHI